MGEGVGHEEDHDGANFLAAVKLEEVLGHLLEDGVVRAQQVHDLVGEGGHLR